PVLVLLRLKSTNVATPFTAATVVVPLSVLPPGLLPSASVTLPVKLGTGFPAGSTAVTWPAGLIAAPDPAGNPVPSFTGSVTLALGSNPGGSTLSGTT